MVALTTINMKRILFLSAFLLLSLQLSAQTNVSDLAKSLTNDALKKSYELNNSQLESEKTEQDIKSAKATYIPKVNAIGAYAYINQDVTVDLPSIQTGISGLNLFEGSQSFGVKGQLGIAAVMLKWFCFQGCRLNMVQEPWPKKRVPKNTYQKRKSMK